MVLRFVVNQQAHQEEAQRGAPADMREQATRYLGIGSKWIRNSATRCPNPTSLCLLGQASHQAHCRVACTAKVRLQTPWLHEHHDGNARASVPAAPDVRP